MIKFERNSSANTKVREEVWEEMLQESEQIFPCSSWSSPWWGSCSPATHGGPWWSRYPSEAGFHTGPWSPARTHTGTAYPMEGLYPVERTHVGMVHEKQHPAGKVFGQLSPIGGMPFWSRERMWRGRSSKIKKCDVIITPIPSPCQSAQGGGKR